MKSIISSSILSIAILLIPSFAYTQVTYSHEYVFYDVPARVPPYRSEEIRQFSPENCKRIKHQNDKYSLACTTTTITYNPYLKMNGTKCSINPYIAVKSISYIPRFNDVDLIEREKGDFLSAYYMNHEIGHFQTYKKEVPKFVSELETIPKLSNCDDMKPYASAVAEKYLPSTGILKQANVQYDIDTEGSMTRGYKYDELPLNNLDLTIFESDPPNTFYQIQLKTSTSLNDVKEYFHVAEYIGIPVSIASNKLNQQLTYSLVAGPIKGLSETKIIQKQLILVGMNGKVSRVLKK